MMAGGGRRTNEAGARAVVEWLFGPEQARAAPRHAPAASPAPVAGYASVALNRPMRNVFTYGVPCELDERVRVGVRVSVPFAGRREIGVVVERTDSTDVLASRIKPLREVLDDEPAVGAEMLELTRWISDYYACSWGEALAAALPAALKREGGRKTVAVYAPAPGVDESRLGELEGKALAKQHRVLRTLLEAGGPIPRVDLLKKLGVTDAPLRSLVKRGLAVVDRVVQAPDALLSGGGGRPRHAELTSDQEEAITGLTAALDEGSFHPALLYGVTGSGKTEVYLRLIEAALERGKGAIVLVPEIALTPQTVGWFVDRFGAVAVLHSGMSDAQRLDMWERVRRGEARVVVGARSAIFAPVPDLGVVVVDEEHEPSYKQASVPRYHARDVAVVRAQKEGAVCVLGSATPSLESWRNAAQDRYHLHRLRARATGQPLPKVEVVDMRGERDERGSTRLFSRRLEQLLREALARGEQAILFINRRGFAPVLWCQQCGETLHCEQCDVAMTWHKRIERMVCHSCCDEIPIPKVCPSCTAPALRFLGAGSQRVEEILSAVVPQAKVGRMDSDTMMRREDYEETLSAFGRGELDVLVGTQMIAKGLDFPKVTLVGIVSADASLHQPDFRAAERTYQLVSQVAGRAGRADLEGHIVVQTTATDEPAIIHAAKHDFDSFALGEDRSRMEHGYPPYRRLLRVVWEDEDESRVQEASARAAAVLREELREHDVEVLGPAPAPMAMLRGRHRRHVLLKAKLTGQGLSRARAILANLQTQRPRTAIDVDPVSMM
ncbi:MAG: primosomal protein N' [Planctomycetota bacterium]|nr:primosomal protein N' [Planctomycetota bacterium]